MDTTDPDIQFNSEGVCNHCTNFSAAWKDRWFPGAEGAPRLEALIDHVRERGKRKPYDCAIGLSGGADSSYLVLKAHEFGLRPLVVHVDTGWNSKEAVANIESLVNYCGFELHTRVIDWDQMRDLQSAYMRAGVPNQDVPQDHAIFSTLYSECVSFGVRDVLSGFNIATEGVFPRAWQWSALDATNLAAIHRRFGTVSLRGFPTISHWKSEVVNPWLLGFRVLHPLNFLHYDQAAVFSALRNACGWRPYGRKHGESRFTKLFQNYILPQRFGFDKRRPHYSSLILSNQTTRSDALRDLLVPLYSPSELEEDLDYFCLKLQISRDEFEDLMDAPRRRHADFPNHRKMVDAVATFKRIAVRLAGRHLRERGRKFFYGS
jgi:N-acetyl sugar amidotransferase